MSKPTAYTVVYEEGKVDGIKKERARVAKIVAELGTQKTRLYIMNQGLNVLQDIIEEMIHEVTTGEVQASKHRYKSE